MTPIRVVVTGAHALGRSGLCAILGQAPDIDVVHETDSDTLLPPVQRLKPDIVLIDTVPPEAGTVELVRSVASLKIEPRVKTLVLAAGLGQHVNELLDAGATGFLLRAADPGQLFAALRMIAAGYAVVALTGETLTGAALHTAVSSVPDGKLSSLTPREHEVLALVVGGYTNAQIAARLTLSESTVKFHVQSLLSKLHLHDRTHAVIYAYETGLIKPGDGGWRRP
jgi:DNA-binding NarL/FixJ family response regulator